MTSLRSRLVLLSLAGALPLSSCGTDAAPQAADTDAADTDEGTGTAAVEEADLQVVASFYPLEFVVGRVAGERAEVTTLTTPGVDPHDVELTPRTVATLSGADLVVVASGMQPAVDDAVASQTQGTSLDVAPAADLRLLGETEEDHAAHAEEDPGEHAGEDGADDGHAHGEEDPHFWLDPQRYADVADAVAERLVELDPEGATHYRANAAALRTDLQTLDEEFTSGLASCESRDVVTTHEAFGYLGERYDLNLVGVTGVSPESEPSPARLAEVAEMVDDLGVGTIYTEPLLPSGIAETVARETGASVSTLDPVEGITEGSAGNDYLEVMRANLSTLREGQGCS